MKILFLGDVVGISGCSKILNNLIKEINPVGRGWSCAILTQKRKTAREIVDYIRRELPGVPVEEEVGSFPAKDNGFSQYLLSLLRAAIHPSDKWAIGHLKMCPFLDLDESEFDKLIARVKEKTAKELGWSSAAEMAAAIKKKKKQFRNERKSQQLKNRLERRKKRKDLRQYKKSLRLKRKINLELEV